MKYNPFQTVNKSFLCLFIKCSSDCNQALQWQPAMDSLSTFTNDRFHKSQELFFSSLSYLLKCSLQFRGELYSYVKTFRFIHSSINCHLVLSFRGRNTTYTGHQDITGHTHHSPRRVEATACETPSRASTSKPYHITRHAPRKISNLTLRPSRP